MRKVYLITHPDVIINPAIPVPRWSLSPEGRERVQRMLHHPWVNGIGSIYCSTEQKAIDRAEILADHLSLAYVEVADLGEIDRTATGYLPHDEHNRVVDAFFADPDQSVQGWETASHAQQRISSAIERLTRDNVGAGDMAMITHGGVATLYLCQLKSIPITRQEAQPDKSGGGFYCFEAQSKALLHGWERIDPL